MEGVTWPGAGRYTEKECWETCIGAGDVTAGNVDELCVIRGMQKDNVSLGNQWGMLMKYVSWENRREVLMNNVSRQNWRGMLMKYVSWENRREMLMNNVSCQNC